MTRLAYGLLPAGAFAAALTACAPGGPATDLPPNLGNDGGGVDSGLDARSHSCDGGGDGCAPATLPPESVSAGGHCTLTSECKAGLYCGADGTCDASGAAGVGDTCSTTASCVRGAVCYRATPGLYGVCALPVGTTLPAGQDGLDGGDGATGGSGTAQGVGGKCTTLLDCEAGLACSASGTCQLGVPGAGLPVPWAGVTCNDAVPADAGTAVRAYFEVPASDGTPPYDFFRLPFPNDIRRDPTTHKLNLTGFPHPGTALLGFDIVELYAQQSESDLDGFGTNQQVYFRFSASINLDTLTVGTGGSVQMYDLTAGGPTDSISILAGTGGDRYLCPNNLKVTTGGPMTPGHTYAVTLSTAIQDTSGHAVARDADFGAMLGSAAPSNPVLASAFAAYAPLRTFLTAQHIDPATLIDASVFTTQSATTEVPLLRTAIRAASAPTASGFVLCAPGVVSPCDDGLTGAAHVRGCVNPPSTTFDELQGQITLPIMQQGTRPYTTLGQGAIQLDATGTPVVQGTEPVCVSITVPHGVTPPSGGWPVILYAHGTGGDYLSGIQEGLPAAASQITLSGSTSAQFAFVAYDGVMTGPRRGAGVTQSPDTLFFNFANPVAARDNVLQGAADVFSLVWALETVSLMNLPAMGTNTAFDPTQIYFMGHSQGSTVGLPAAPFEPGLAGMVFSGAGGDLREALVTKQSPVDLANLTPYVLQDAPVDATHPALNLFQAFIERSDAINYGGALLQNLPMGAKARPLLQTYGIGDTYTPAPTLQAVAQAIGLNAAGPVLGTSPWPSGTPLALPVTNNFETSSGSVTAALIEGDPMGAYDGHFILFDNPTIETRVMKFLGTAQAGMATIE